jgi:TMEM175 potassium channel family protein
VNEPSGEERGLDLDRVVFFSDAVFAIAMTVLVLSIHVPSVSHGQIGRALRDQLPAIYSYFLSFAVIALYWLVHHRMFHWIQRIDGTAITINLVLLSFVAILPFPTDLLGRYGDTPVGTMTYAAAIAAVGATSSTLWWYVSHTPGLLRPDTPPRYVRHGQLRALAATAVFALSIPVALWSVVAAQCMWLLLIPARMVLSRRFGSLYAAPNVTR